jgi:transcription elongation factor Elf1
MALMHRCPNGTATKLIRTGPVGTAVGAAFHCPNCGHVKSAVTIELDFVAALPKIIAALGR